VANGKDFRHFGGIARQQHERRGTPVQMPKIDHEGCEILRRIEPGTDADGSLQFV
jgi:hypothetical protein